MDVKNENLLSEDQKNKLKEILSEEQMDSIDSVLSNERSHLQTSEEMKLLGADGYDPTNPYHVFCWEFQESLKKYINYDQGQIKDQYGNWFGRLVAFGYEISFLGNNYKEDASTGTNVDPFRDAIRAGRIRIKNFTTDFRSLTVKPPYAILTGIIEVTVVIIDEMGNSHRARAKYHIEPRIMAKKISFDE